MPDEDFERAFISRPISRASRAAIQSEHQRLRSTGGSMKSKRSRIKKMPQKTVEQ